MKCGLCSKLGNLNPKMGFGEPNKALSKWGLQTKSGQRELILEQIPFLEKERGEKGEES